MTQRICFVFLILFHALFFCQEKIKKNPSPKIGLALAGGGAKGFAHIGVLKMIDSLNLKIDYISGTSMGAIIGGLYASGYKAKDIEKIILETDFYTILDNGKNRMQQSFIDKTNEKYLLNMPIEKGKINIIPKSISTGQKNLFLLKKTLSQAHINSDFSQLKIPFLCIGTNLETGKIKIFEDGNLEDAIMASSAYPSLLDPVKIKDSLYIDGAMSVNFPAKILKDKGMDIVIGVDLSQPLSSKEELNSAFSILNQIIHFQTKKENLIQHKYADILIIPDLKNYSATSYSEKEEILKIGNQTAQKFLYHLSPLPKKNNAESDSSPLFYPTFFKIDSLWISQNHTHNEDYVAGKMRFRLPSLQTHQSVHTMIERLYTTQNYHFINYYLENYQGKNVLKLDLQEQSVRFFLNAGLHYDPIFKSSLLLNFTAKRFLFKNSILSIDGIIGDKPRYYFNYIIDNGYIPGVGLYSFGGLLELRNSQGNTYDFLRRFSNKIYMQSIISENLAFSIGMEHQFHESQKINQEKFHNPQHLFSPYFSMKSDTRDDFNFPTKGFSFGVEAKIFHHSLFKKIEDQILQIKSDFQFNIPLGRFSYRMDLMGGFSIGKNSLPDYTSFYLGGIFAQNLGNFFPFGGNFLGSYSGRNVFILGSDLQYKILKNYFLTAHFTSANIFDNFTSELFWQNQKNSLGITAGYRSPLGQIKINYSRAFENHKGIFSVILGHWF